MVMEIDVEDGKPNIVVALSVGDAGRLTKFFRDYKAMIKSIPPIDEKTDCPICEGVDPNCWYCC